MSKMFKLLKTVDDSDVLGGEVGEDNVYIKTYGSVLPGEKLPADLEVGETTLKEYRLSGQKPTVYKIVRVS